METAAPERTGPYSRLPSGLTATLLRYMEARGQLLSIEAQEALQQVVRVLILTAIGIIMTLTGWLLLSAGLAALIIETTGWSAIKSILVLAGAELLLAAVLFLAALLRLRSARWFSDTLNEFQKDRSWLAQEANKS